MATAPWDDVLLDAMIVAEGLSTEAKRRDARKAALAAFKSRAFGTAPAPTPTPTPTPTPSPTALQDLARVPWEGGPAYYASWPKASAKGWTDPNFFPIGVWLESPTNAQALYGLGINVMVGANHWPGVDVPAYQADTSGMSYILDSAWTPTDAGSYVKAVGWLAADEVDMTSTSPVTEQQATVNGLRSRNDGRFVYANYSKGVFNTWWAKDQMPQLTQMLDVASADVYYYTDPWLDAASNEQSAAWPKGACIRCSSGYGWTVERMRSFCDPAKIHPTWNFVEDGHPFSETGSTTITPAQLEGAVWASIVHECRGILYFNHSFGGSCQSQHVLFDCDPAMKAKVYAVNSQIRALAPVLNSQSYVWAACPSVATMLKAYGGEVYLFACIGQNQSTGTKTFTLPAGVTGTLVTVVGENRTLPVNNGTFVDSFLAEYAHHTYRATI